MRKKYDQEGITETVNTVTVREKKNHLKEAGHKSQQDIAKNYALSWYLDKAEPAAWAPLPHFLRASWFRTFNCEKNKQAVD